MPSDTVSLAIVGGFFAFLTAGVSGLFGYLGKITDNRTTLAVQTATAQVKDAQDSLKSCEAELELWRGRAQKLLAKYSHWFGKQMTFAEVDKEP